VKRAIALWGLNRVEGRGIEAVGGLIAREEESTHTPPETERPGLIFGLGVAGSTRDGTPG
jgi:hypothetical protein